MFKWLFTRKKNAQKYTTIDETMAYMASLGVSPDNLLKYEQISRTIKSKEGANS